MGIIKFLFTFLFFYFLIKVVRTLFFVNKAVKSHKKATQRQSSHIKTPESEDDIIEAEYKVVDDKK